MESLFVLVVPKTWAKAEGLSALMCPPAGKRETPRRATAGGPGLVARVAPDVPVSLRVRRDTRRVA